MEKITELIREAEAMWEKARDEGVHSDAFYDLQVILYKIEELIEELVEERYAGEKGAY